MTVKELRKHLKELLQSYLVDEADSIGDIVCAAALATDRSGLLLRLDEEVSANCVESANDMVRKLMTGMPVQYVLGECFFYGLPIKVALGCFIPRSDTELLVAEAIKLLPKQGNFADICTGSGCISKAIAANRPDVTGVALDYYPKPLRCAEQNLTEEKNVRVMRFDALEPDDYDMLGKVDVIVCNPPYIPSEEIEYLDANVKFEPETALDGGEDGLRFYRAVAQYGSARLNEGGAILFEAGINQAKDIEALLSAQGLETYTRNDFGGIQRLVAGIKR